MKLTLKKYRRLSSKELKLIEALAQICEKEDGARVKHYWNVLANRKTDEFDDYLLFSNNRLMGYLATYQFEPSSVEVSAMIHPRLRRRGLFKRLFKAAEGELAKRFLSKQKYMVKRGFKPGEAVIKGLGGVYQSSEYEFVFNHDLFKALPAPKHNVRLEGATEKDIDILTTIDKACFGNPYSETKSRIVDGLAQPNRFIWIAYNDDDEVIGKIHVRYDQKYAYIHNFTVPPEKQHRGYGRAILQACLQILLDAGHEHIALDVISDNEKAIGLYQNCAFDLVADYDYYERVL